LKSALAPRVFSIFDITFDIYIIIIFIKCFSILISLKGWGLDFGSLSWGHRSLKKRRVCVGEQRNVYA